MEAARVLTKRGAVGGGGEAAAFSLPAAAAATGPTTLSRAPRGPAVLAANAGASNAGGLAKRNVLTSELVESVERQRQLAAVARVPDQEELVDAVREVRSVGFNNSVFGRKPFAFAVKEA